MKTIKQRISYAVMSLMAMGFTACTQNEDMAPTLKGVYSHSKPTPLYVRKMKIWLLR